jgi:hypothetical protein
LFEVVAHQLAGDEFKQRLLAEYSFLEFGNDAQQDGREGGDAF